MHARTRRRSSEARDPQLEVVNDSDGKPAPTHHKVQVTLRQVYVHLAGAVCWRESNSEKPAAFETEKK